MLKLTMDYKMTKHMLNNCTLKESRTWLLVCTRHCYFIPFNREHPVSGKFEYERPGPVRPRDAFQKVVSLQQYAPLTVVFSAEWGSEKWPVTPFF